MKNLKNIFFALTLIVAACSQQSALAAAESDAKPVHVDAMVRITFSTIITKGSVGVADRFVDGDESLKLALKAGQLGLLEQVINAGQYEIAQMLVKKFHASLAGLSHAAFDAYRIHNPNAEMELGLQLSELQLVDGQAAAPVAWEVQAGARLSDHVRSIFSSDQAKKPKQKQAHKPRRKASQDYDYVAVDGGEPAEEREEKSAKQPVASELPDHGKKSQVCIIS